MVQEGELFGVANLLSARQTSMLRDRERESQLKYEIKLMEIENKTTGAGGGGAAAAGASGSASSATPGDAGDDDEAWQIAAQEVILEDADEASDKANADGARARAGGGAGVSVEALLNGLTVHQHGEIVGEDEKEVAMARRARKVRPVRSFATL